MLAGLSKSSKQIIEDEIGPKILCFMCSQHFYYFQYSDHVESCMKTQHFSRPQVEEEPKDRQEEKPEKQESEQEEEEREEEVDPKSREWLHRFQEMRSNVSRIAQVSRVKDKKVSPEDEDQLTVLPCPFCGKILQLTDLEHIDSCSSSKQCIHCHDKYPRSLMQSHLSVCQKKKGKKINPIARLNSSRENKAIHPPMRFGNYRPPELKEERPFRKLQLFSYKPKEKIRKEERIDPEQLQQASRVRLLQFKGLSEKQMNSLPCSLYLPDQNSEPQDCSICCQNLQLAEQTVNLPCSHIFHKECLFPWLESRSTCPTCKARILG